MKKFLFSKECYRHSWKTICIIAVVAIVILLKANFSNAGENVVYHEYVMTYGTNEEYSNSIRASDVRSDGMLVTYYLDDNSILHVNAGSAVREFSNGYVEVYNNVRITTQ